MHASKLRPESFLPKGFKKLQNMQDNDRQKMLKTRPQIFCRLHNQYTWPYLRIGVTKKASKQHWNARNGIKSTSIYMGRQSNGTQAHVKNLQRHDRYANISLICQRLLRVCQVLRLQGQAGNTMNIALSHHVFLQIWRMNSRRSIIKMLYNSTSAWITKLRRRKVLEFFKHKILPGLALTKLLI